MTHERERKLRVRTGDQAVMLAVVIGIFVMIAGCLLNAFYGLGMGLF